MGINVFPTPTTVSSIATGWTAGVAGTFLLSNTLTAGTYLIKTDSTQSMTITLKDSGGRKYAGTIRGGSGFITVPVAVNQIIIPGSLTYPFGIEITPISVTQLAAPTSASLSYADALITGTWGTAPADATGAVLFTPTGDVLNFSSTASGATVGVTSSNTVPGSSNEFVVAFKNSSGAIGLGAVYSVTMPSAPYAFLAEYLVVGGGASSGGNGGYGKGGAGGGGAVKTSSSYVLTPNATLSITIGATQTNSSTGGNSSVLAAITAAGGGGGGDSGPITGANGKSGASGGGAWVGNSSTATYTGGSATDGFAGATVTNNGSSTGGIWGGGGGAGGAASNKQAGPGVASSITGAAVYYGGGGNGQDFGGYGTTGNGATAGGSAGAANTGAGGATLSGGAQYASGGSGVVIIAYPIAQPALTTIPGTLTYSVSTSSRTGYRVYTFTAGTGTVTI